MLMDLFFTLPRRIMEEPLGIQAWIFWMILVNTASLFFLGRAEGKLTFAVWIANLIFMSALCYFNGYNRLLGLSHVLFWTPLVVYLFRSLRTTAFQSPFGAWLRLLLLTNVASLVIDYLDVIRYLLGERGNS